MIGYVTLGSNDIPRIAGFYDALLGDLGAKRLMEMPHVILWGLPGQPMLGVIRPNNGQAATVGNGTMVSLSAGNRDNVDRLHARALALGCTDEGAPGERFKGFYIGYFRDIDGNKLSFFHMGA